MTIVPVTGLIAFVIFMTGASVEATTWLNDQAPTVAAQAALYSFQQITGVANFEYVQGSDVTWSQTVAAVTASTGDPAVTYSNGILTSSVGSWCYQADVSQPGTPYSVTTCQQASSTTTP